MKERVISVLIPLYNEAENLKPLFQRINKSLSEFGRDFEVIFVNDASSDDSEKLLGEIQRVHDNVTVINFFRRMGKAVALEQGFEIANGRYVVIIDGDLQYDPEDIPKLIKKMDEGFDVVSGKRINRQDPNGKIITSRLFNILMRWLTELKFEDYFSGLKCFRLSVINYLALYGDLYRFASVFAFRNGFKVTEIAVKHHHRAHGTSKYTSWMRFKRGISDLIVVAFSITFDRKRSYRLGMAGLLLVSMGFTLLILSILAIKPLEIPFGDLLWRTGLIILLIGVQFRLIKNAADEFFIRHQDRNAQRVRNVRNILRCEENLQKAI